MTPQKNPQKKIESILKEVEKGKTLESETDTLMQILNENPSIIPDVIKSLSIVMGKVDQKPYISACMVLNSIADQYLDKVSELFEMTIELLKYREKEINEKEWIPTLELFTKIHQGYPEKMRVVIPGLFTALGNPNASIREAAYYLLAHIATTDHDLFKDRTKEMIRALGGLNIDERIYACKIIRILAEKNPLIVSGMFDYLEDLFLNHPDNDLRSEAGFAADKLRPVCAPKKPDASISSEVSKETTMKKDAMIFSGITSMLSAKDKIDLDDALDAIIKNRVIESAALVDTGGRVLSYSGNEMDSSLLNKLVSMLALDSSDTFNGRISIEQAEKKIVAIRVGSKAVLVVVTGADTSIGMLHIMLNKLVETIKVILMDAGFT